MTPMSCKVRSLWTRHEQATGYMADGYARTGGREGVCMVVPGPGLLNTTAALSTAYACNSPVLCISGQVQYIPWGNRLYPPFATWALAKYVTTVAVVALPGGGDDVPSVVSSHPPPPAARVRGRLRGW